MQISNVIQSFVERARGVLPGVPAEERRAEMAAQERLMQLTEADLRERAAQSGCMYGELCGGIGFIGFDLPQEHPQFGQSFPCQCRASELNARRLLRLFDDAEVPPLYRGLGFDTFEKLPDLDGKTGRGRAPRRQRRHFGVSHPRRHTRPPDMSCVPGAARATVGAGRAGRRSLHGALHQRVQGDLPAA